MYILGLMWRESDVNSGICIKLESLYLELIAYAPKFEIYLQVHCKFAEDTKNEPQVPTSNLFIIQYMVLLKYVLLRILEARGEDGVYKQP